MAVSIFVLLRPLSAQTVSHARTSVHGRAGAFLTSPLVTQTIPDGEITLRQRPGPVGTMALRLPLRPTTHLEISTSVSRSAVRGHDGAESWEVADVTAASFVVGIGRVYRDVLALRAGFGVTKLFAKEHALFRDGTSPQPLLEAGVARGLRIAGRPAELDLRIQSHRFGTPALRAAGGTDGNVTRVVLQIGTALWQARDR